MTSTQKISLQDRIYQWATDLSPEIREYLIAKTDKIKIEANFQSHSTPIAQKITLMGNKKDEQTIPESTYLAETIYNNVFHWLKNSEYPFKIVLVVSSQSMCGQIINSFPNKNF